MIEVEHLWKVYETVEAVRDLSFVVEPGEVLGLVGPNGAGKTSTMRCLCGIIPPSAGEIGICGLSMFEAPVEAKRQVAFVPSEPRYFPYLTVWEHLQMFARLYDCGDQSERASALIESMSLVEKRDHLPESLSRGMQQKLMIACALIHKPKVLIFDEPFTGLDPLAIRNIRKLLRGCADDGAAVLLSSHLLAMVEDMVDRVLIIQGGQKVAHGSLQELAAAMPRLRQNADLEELFLHATGSQLPDEESVAVSSESDVVSEAGSSSASSGVVGLAAGEGDERELFANAGLPAPITTPVPLSTPAAVSLDVVGGDGGHDGVDVGVDLEVDVASLLGAYEPPTGRATAPLRERSDGPDGADLPVSSSEVLPQYTRLEGSQASLDGLPAVEQGKWFAAENDALLASGDAHEAGVSEASSGDKGEVIAQASQKSGESTDMGALVAGELSGEPPKADEDQAVEGEPGAASEPQDPTESR